MNNRYYFYKMTVDNGGAPCDQDNMLTLAICKPMIRSSAGAGNWIYGFGGVALKGRLVYIAEVKDKIMNSDYYSHYHNRRDAIYQFGKEGFKIKNTARYHNDGKNIFKDLGKHPEYSKANVLLCDNYRYLGNKGEQIDKSEYPNLCKVLDLLSRGHRVNHAEQVLGELIKLRKQIWHKYPSISSVGSPINGIPDGKKGCC